MEEIIKHIDMEMLKSYSYQGSYTDEYLFFTDKLEIYSRKIKMSNWSSS